MRTWVAMWIFPVGVVGTLALLVQGSWVTQVAALLWALGLVPTVAVKLLRRSPGAAEHFRDFETDYWRSEPR